VVDALTKPAAAWNRRLEIAVLVPCLNEAACIARVIESFRQALPDARIYVYDNGSSDDTAAVAAAAGAEVRSEPMRGKGNVVRRMFADIEADVFVMVDGDGTYHAASAPAMIELLTVQHLDMVCGKRVESDGGAYRSGHRLGNRVLTGLVAALFGNRVSDILSGYRVMSRRFVKSFPALSRGFETETELTVHALDLRAPVAELATPYGSRVAGSTSKLNTFRDGWRMSAQCQSLFEHGLQIPCRVAPQNLRRNARETCQLLEERGQVLTEQSCVARRRVGARKRLPFVRNVKTLRHGPFGQ